MSRMIRKAPEQYRVLSLFSGGMGLDLGLEKTGRFKTVACIEKEPAFCETIRQNRDAGRLPRELQVLEADLAKVDPADALNQLGIDPLPAILLFVVARGRTPTTKWQCYKASSFEFIPSRTYSK